MNRATSNICTDLGINCEQTPLSPAAFLRKIKTLKVLGVVSIDELDDLPKDSLITEAFARFAKAASNQAEDLNVKFVFSGIGKDGDNLFGGHLSSERNLPELRLFVLKTDDLRAFLDKACEMLSVEVPRHLKEAIVADAMGFPYYLHLACYNIFFEHALGDPTLPINEGHYKRGTENALSGAFAHYLKRYKFTIYELSDLEKHILGVFLRRFKSRGMLDEIVGEAALMAGRTKDEAKRAARQLYSKKYLRFREGDETISLYDALLRPFLMKKLDVPAPVGGSKRKTAQPDGEEQLDML